MINNANDDPLEAILCNYENEKSCFSTSNLRYKSTRGYTSIQRVIWKCYLIKIFGFKNQKNDKL